MGWVPVKRRALKREGEAFRFAGNTFRVFYSRPLPEGKITDGTNFSRDRRGNWFLGIVVELMEAAVRAPVRGVGIDLGLHDLAALGDGSTIAAPHFYREGEAALAAAQRAQTPADRRDPRAHRQPTPQFSASVHQPDRCRIRLYCGRQRQCRRPR
jgi:putative transposase